MKHIKLFETTLTRLENILSLKYAPHWIAKVKKNVFASSVEQDRILQKSVFDQMIQDLKSTK